MYGQVLNSPSLINCLVFCLHTSNNKLRSQVAYVLAGLCVLSLKGHSLVLNAFSDFRQVHEEEFRFQYLMETLKTNDAEEDNGSVEYKSACLSLINSIVSPPEDVEERILLRKEFERRGLIEIFSVNLLKFVILSYRMISVSLIYNNIYL